MTALIEAMRSAGIEFDDPLSEAEFDDLELALGFQFAAEHREFLAQGLPVAGPRETSRWPQWRSPNPEALHHHLAAPVDGVLFDIEENGLWPLGWGGRPDDPVQALREAEDRLAAVPVLVPLFGHRFVPAGPWDAPLPVLSVMQSDVVGYGVGLTDWVDREFGVRIEGTATHTGPVTVQFWSSLGR